MLERFQEYFRAIEMSQTLQQRAEQLCTEFVTLITGDVKKVFVSDGYDDEGVRRYHSLFLIYGDRLSELKDFVTTDNIDFINLSQTRIIEVKKYDLGILSGETTIKSRMEINLMIGTDIGVEFRAVHKNCLYLWELMKSSFLPILK
jgi:hypothetical protein